MPYDKNGLFTWCETCRGDGCPECDDDFDGDSIDDYEFEHDTTCIVMADESPLCDQSAVTKEDDGTDVIPW